MGVNENGISGGEVADNSGSSRFEPAEAGEIAFSTYRLSGDILTIPYVESPPSPARQRDRGSPDGVRCRPCPGAETQDHPDLQLRRILVSSASRTCRHPECRLRDVVMARWFKASA